jgi:hypothetical protein
MCLPVVDIEALWLVFFPSCFLVPCNIWEQKTRRDEYCCLLRCVQQVVVDDVVIE